MATQANTTRRSLFAIAGAASLLPAAALAATAQRPADPWDHLLAGLSVLHPELPALAVRAREQGYKVSELRLVMVPKNGDAPFIEFNRAFNSHLLAVGEPN